MIMVLMYCFFNSNSMHNIRSMSNDSITLLFSVTKSELMKEKSKFQRTINKKNEEHRNLLEEVIKFFLILQNPMHA